MRISYEPQYQSHAYEIQLKKLIEASKNCSLTLVSITNAMEATYNDGRNKITSLKKELASSLLNRLIKLKIVDSNFDRSFNDYEIKMLLSYVKNQENVLIRFSTDRMTRASLSRYLDDLQVNYHARDFYHGIEKRHQTEYIIELIDFLDLFA